MLALTRDYDFAVCVFMGYLLVCLSKNNRTEWTTGKCFKKESAKLRALASTHLTHHLYPPTRLRTLRACAPLLLPISALRVFFLSCIVVSIVKYGLRLKNPRKATGRDFITLKVIKFGSNVIDCHLNNIIIKDLEKKKYSEEPKTALVWPIFKQWEKQAMY